MLELYSLNVEVDQNSSIPFNNVDLAKGCTAVLTAPGTVQFNKSGVYMVDVSASITPAATGTARIQLARNSVLDIGSFSEATAAADQTTALGFTSLVQVPKNNNPCNCIENPTTIQLMNTSQTGQISTFPIVRMVVTKVC